MDTHEEWKVIDFTKNKYSVSSEGRIRNNNTGVESNSLGVYYANNE